MRGHTSRGKRKDWNKPSGPAPSIGLELGDPGQLLHNFRDDGGWGYALSGMTGKWVNQHRPSALSWEVPDKGFALSGMTGCRASQFPAVPAQPVIGSLFADDGAGQVRPVAWLD